MAIDGTPTELVEEVVCIINAIAEEFASLHQGKEGAAKTFILASIAERCAEDLQIGSVIHNG